MKQYSKTSALLGRFETLCLGEIACAVTDMWHFRLLDSAYAHAARAQRKNLQRDDVYKAVANTDIFDFLEMVLKASLVVN